jgi:DNA-binding NtrC family response regulator
MKITNHETTPLLLDLEPPEPDGAMAARYMRAHLDDQIRQHEDVERPGAPPDELRELLRLRYGALLAGVVKQRGEDWQTTVARAAGTRGDGPRPGVNARLIEWDPVAGTEWFRREVDRRWPADQVGAPFLAADPVTLWTVCLALDLAPHRTAKLADDPFPAPPLLITGPTGIGKELLAKAIHECSGDGRRGPGPFGAINCGGLPTQLLESELFGHERGAFTGAVKEKKGLVEQYKDGTLFLDEVGDMPPEVQVRLLRFLNNGEARRVGSNTSYHATPRIIAATHVDLAERASKGEFRTDLLHRLRGRHLHFRGLAERPQSSLGTTLGQFLAFASSLRGQPPPQLTTELRVALTKYSWPGNMREVKYVVERMLDTRAQQGMVGLEVLPEEMIAAYLASTPTPMVDVLTVMARRERGEPQIHLHARLTLLLGERFSQHQKRELTRAASLEQTAGTVRRIGRVLDLEAAAEPYARILEWAAQEAMAEEFQKDTLAELKAAADQLQVEIGDAFRTYQELTDRLRDEARKGASELQGALRESEAQYAATAVLAAGVRIAQESDSKVVHGVVRFAENLLQLAESPPFRDAAKRFGQRLGSMSPQDAREIFGRAEDEMTATTRWTQARGSLSALEREIVDAGTVTAAAKALGIRPETLSRTRSALRREAAKKSRKKARRLKRGAQ